MVRKRKAVLKEVKKDHTISMVILGVVAVLAIVGLVLLFSAAQKSGMFAAFAPKVYGGAIKGEGSFVHQGIGMAVNANEGRGIPATVMKPGSNTETETAWHRTAITSGVQDIQYGHVPAWNAWDFERDKGRNRKWMRSCGDGAIRLSYPEASYYAQFLECGVDKIGRDAAGLCCLSVDSLTPPRRSSI